MTTATARRLTLAELSHKERNERFDRLQENAQRLGDRAIQISPTHISFDKVTVKDVASRTVILTNTGHADLVITIAPPVQHAVFKWEPVSGQAIAPGASVTVDVEFSPPGAGPAQGQLRVDSNAAGSPHIVTLEGTGVKGNTS